MLSRDEVLRVARENGAFLNVLLHGRHDNVVLTSGEAENFYRAAYIAGLEAAKEASDKAYATCEVLGAIEKLIEEATK